MNGTTQNSAAIQELIAQWQSPDPYRSGGSELHALQLQAIDDRLQQQRARLKVLDSSVWRCSSEAPSPI